MMVDFHYYYGIIMVLLWYYGIIIIMVDFHIWG